MLNEFSDNRGVTISNCIKQGRAAFSVEGLDIFSARDGFS